MDLTNSPEKSDQGSLESVSVAKSATISEKLKSKPGVNRVANETENETDNETANTNNSIEEVVEKLPPPIKKSDETKSPKVLNECKPSGKTNEKSNTTIKKTSPNRDSLKQPSIMTLIANKPSKAESSSCNTKEELNKMSNADDSQSEHLETTPKESELLQTPPTAKEDTFLSPVSVPSDSPAPSPVTPVSSKKVLGSTNRKITPKQLQRMKEKEEKIKEKERLKEVSFFVKVNTIIPVDQAIFKHS